MSINTLLYYLEHPYEVCVNMEKKLRNHEVFLDFDAESWTNGSELNDQTKRGSCKMKRYSDYILHTHSIYSRAYPSSEDILKVCKRKTIKYSFIVTSWGIWQLYAGNKSVLNSADTSMYLEQIQKIIDKYDKIYPKYTAINKITMGYLKQKELNSISRLLEKKLSNFDFKIVFTSWKEINKQNNNYELTEIF